MTKRAIFYDDGFNLYHAIDALRRPHLKWLSLRKLAETVVRQKTERVTEVIFFSALPTHLARNHPDKMQRHNAYVRALESTDVECILGQFKRRQLRCHKCSHSWQSAEEKETDVHIGARMVRDAYRDTFDVMYLISNDTDLSPAIRIIKEDFPDKEIVGLMTPGRGRYAAQLDKITDRKQKLSPDLLARCLLPAKLQHPDGKDVVRPVEYDLPG